MIIKMIIKREVEMAVRQIPAEEKFHEHVHPECTRVSRCRQDIGIDCH